MKGTIRAKDRCSYCGTGFAGAELRCSCGRQPEGGIYIDLHWSAAPGGRLKIYSDKDGHPFKARAYAQSALDAIRYEIRHATFDPKNYVAQKIAALRFEVFARRWLTIREAQAERGEITRATLAKNRICLKSYLVPGLQGQDIRQIRAIHVEEFAAALQLGIDGKKVGAASRAYCMRLLRKLLHDAQRWGEISQVPPICGTADPEPMHDQISLDELDQVVAKVDVWHQPIFVFLARQPVRPGEACALQWRDLDLVAATVHIRRTMSLRKARDNRKSGQPYVLPLHADVLAMLRQLRAACQPEPHPTAFVFLTTGRGMLPKIEDPEAFAAELARRRRGPYTPGVLDRIWDRACGSVVGRHVTLYEGTRHLIASEAVSRGIDIGAVSRALGHKHIATTMKSYARYRTEALRQVIDLRPPSDANGPSSRPQTGPGPEAQS